MCFCSLLETPRKETGRQGPCCWEGYIKADPSSHTQGKHASDKDSRPVLYCAWWCCFGLSVQPCKVVPVHSPEVVFGPSLSQPVRSSRVLWIGTEGGRERERGRQSIYWLRRKTHLARPMTGSFSVACNRARSHLGPFSLFLPTNDH